VSDRPLSGYRRHRPGTQPEYLHAPYRSSVKRAPRETLVALPPTLSEITGPTFGADDAEGATCDLTRQHAGDPLGERIVVGGRVIDEDGRPLRRSLVEVWQANAAGRYLHPADQHEAPLDPHFTGSGHLLTDDDGRYRIVTIRPGAYPWGNHANAWRPAHIHFSVFGRAFATRLVTQMYFPDDPLLPHDPIFNCTADERARQRLVSTFDWEATKPGYALGYRFDIVLAGRDATPLEAASTLEATTSQTVGPFFSVGMGWLKRDDLAASGVASERVIVEGRVLDGDGQGVPDALLELWQANDRGRYRHPEDAREDPVEAAFDGFGRVATDEDGRFRFTTVRPGPVPGPAGALQAPHLAVSVFARGLMKRLVTRMYFPARPENAGDFVLGLVGPHRRATLVAETRGNATLEWNVVLQGPGETVFFEC
jgi:protocatechuate 3,4-dioxygenase beta subunit